MFSQVGAKSRNISYLKGKVPSWIGIPTSVALPFGVFEHVLSDKSNQVLHLIPIILHFHEYIMSCAAYILCSSFVLGLLCLSTFSVSVLIIRILIWFSYLAYINI